MKVLAPLLLCLAVVGCSRSEHEGEELGIATEKRPVAEYTGTTHLDMHEGSHLSWTLRTEHLVRQSATDLVRAKPVNMTVYDSLGQEMVWVTADSGAVDEQLSFLSARGNVHVRSVKGVEVNSDSLRWNKASDQISTEAKVRVVSEDGDVLSGKGFVSDAKLDRWQILGQVRGVFQKVQERIGPAMGDSSGAAANPSQPSDGVPAQPEEIGEDEHGE